MKRPRISHSEFSLPFLVDDSDGLDSHDTNGSNPRASSIETFEAQIPADAIFLGTVDSEVSSCCTWKVDDHFYLLPVKNGRFEWALFRISWDDNWSRYEWSPESRLAGVSNPVEAARRLLRDAFSRWGIDLRKRDAEPYRDLLRNTA